MRLKISMRRRHAERILHGAATCGVHYPTPPLLLSVCSNVCSNSKQIKLSSSRLLVNLCCKSIESCTEVSLQGNRVIGFHRAWRRGVGWCVPRCKTVSSAQLSETAAGGEAARSRRWPYLSRTPRNLRGQALDNVPVKGGPYPTTTPTYFVPPGSIFVTNKTKVSLFSYMITSFWR